MKTFLLMVALFAAVACASSKSKRDVSHLLKGNAQYLPPHQHVQPQTQLNRQYLTPVKQSLELPSTSYGVPFNPAPSAPVTSYGTPVVNHVPAPVVHQAPVYQAPAPVYQASAPVYQAPAPVVHQAPVYRAPAPAVHQAPVYQAPAPVVHQAPVYQAPAPVVHQAPVYQVPARVVFDAPVQSIVVSEKVSYEQVPSAPVQQFQHGSSYSGFQYSQQQQNVGSNGGYVY